MKVFVEKHQRPAVLWAMGFLAETSLKLKQDLQNLILKNYPPLLSGNWQFNSKEVSFTEIN